MQLWYYTWERKDFINQDAIQLENCVKVLNGVNSFLSIYDFIVSLMRTKEIWLMPNFWHSYSSELMHLISVHSSGSSSFFYLFADPKSMKTNIDGNVRS
jgi:hypothetical protein